MLSVVVVVHDMRREAVRTLRSLTPGYQRRIAPAAYEVVVVEAGSRDPLGREVVEGFGPGFRYVRLDADGVSPAPAANLGVRLARFPYVGLFIDGARVASPGLLHFAQRGLALAERPVVAALAWHLGPRVQWLSMLDGYDRDVEDRLLERSGWPRDGYALFSIATLAGSSSGGWFRTPAESNALFMPRALFDELGGFDERFVSEGGGWVNGDLFVRACAAEATELVILLGEGTFHQIHGGASTNVAGPDRAARVARFAAEYAALHGRPFAAPAKEAVYLGGLPRQAHDVLLHSVRRLVAEPERPARVPAAVPVVFCIDCEPDGAVPVRGGGGPWTWVERCIEDLEPERGRLEDATGAPVHFTWAVRADPQLGEIHGDAAWGLRHYREAWQGFAARGDDVALHPHPQRWCPDAQAWVGVQHEPGWPAHVTRQAHAAYRAVLGVPPVTFRFGNRYLDGDLVRCVEELGFLHDLTLEPGYPGRSGTRPDHRTPGRCPSYFEAPREPYRPSAADHLVPDLARTSGLWIVPMSTAPIEPEAPRSQRPHHRAVSPGLYRYEVLHLRMPPPQFRDAVDRLLHELARPYLAVVIRSDMIALREVWENLSMLRAHPWARCFTWTTSAGALRRLGYERDAVPPPHAGSRS